MKLTHPQIEKIFDTDCGKVNTLVIENQRFLSELLRDMTAQKEGFDGQWIVSENESILPFDRSLELLDVFVPFELNRKPLITKLCAALEKCAVLPELFEATGEILTRVTEYLDTLAYELPNDIIFPKVNIGSIIKSASPEFRDEYDSIAEKVIDYFELVRQLDCDKLFVTFNLRSFIDDEETEQFMKTVLGHGYHVVMIESSDRPRLPSECRLVIDTDLCEID